MVVILNGQSRLWSKLKIVNQIIKTNISSTPFDDLLLMSSNETKLDLYKLENLKEVFSISWKINDFIHLNSKFLFLKPERTFRFTLLSLTAAIFQYYLYSFLKLRNFELNFWLIAINGLKRKRFRSVSEVKFIFWLI